MFAETVHAMAPGGDPGAGGAGGSFGFLLPMVVIFVIFWLLLIRPQAKERQKHQKMLDSLKAGDNIITTGGILGTVYSVSDDTVEVKIADKTKITVLRSAIRGFQGEPAKEQS